MTKKENIVSYTRDELEALRAEENFDFSKFLAMTDEEAEANAASDPDDPTNAPGFWESSEQCYPLPSRTNVTINIDEELLRFMQQHRWNVETSINAALREYMRHHPK